MSRAAVLLDLRLKGAEEAAEDLRAMGRDGAAAFDRTAAGATRYADSLDKAARARDRLDRGGRRGGGAPDVDRTRLIFNDALLKADEPAGRAAGGMARAGAATQAASEKLREFANQGSPALSVLARLGPAGLVAGVGIAAVGLAAAEAARQAREAVRDFAAIGERAEALAITADTLQALEGGALLAGLDPAAVQGLVSSFTDVARAARDTSSETATALRALDPAFAATLAGSRDIDEGLRAAIDTLSRMQDPVAQAELAARLFGEEQARLVLRLIASQQGFHGLEQAAAAAGLTIGTDMIEDARELEAKFAVLSRVIDLELKKAFIDLAPALVDVLTFLRDIIVVSRQAINAVTEAGRAKNRAEGLAGMDDGALTGERIRRASAITAIQNDPSRERSAREAALTRARAELAAVDAEIQRRFADDEARRTAATDRVILEEGMGRARTGRGGRGGAGRGAGAGGAPRDDAARAAAEGARLVDQATDGMRQAELALARAQGDRQRVIELELFATRERLDAQLRELEERRAVIGEEGFAAARAAIDRQRQVAEETAWIETRQVTADAERAAAEARERAAEAMRRNAEELTRLIDGQRAIEIDQAAARGDRRTVARLELQGARERLALALEELAARRDLTDEEKARREALLRGQGRAEEDRIRDQEIEPWLRAGERAGDAFKRGVFGEMEWDDVGKSIVDDFLSTLYDELIGNPLKDAIRQLIRDILSPEGGGGSAGGGGWEQMIADFLIAGFGGGGGTPGKTGGGRKTFHAGASITGEVPALLQSGERVLSRQDNGALLAKVDAALSRGAAPASPAPMRVTVHNHADARVETRERTGQMGERELLVMIRRQVQAAAGDGSLDPALRARFGLRPQPGSR